MTTENDRAYFKAHPEYYMYLHPEEPSYEALMAARDRFVGRHPRLAFDGAHMASLEWSVDELAALPRSLSQCASSISRRACRTCRRSRPRIATGCATSSSNIRIAILYGTDLTDSPPDPAARAQNPPATNDFAAEADRVWRNDWRYLATPLASVSMRSTPTPGARSAAHGHRQDLLEECAALFQPHALRETQAVFHDASRLDIGWQPPSRHPALCRGLPGGER
jgi:hypothetical protein